MPIFQTKEKKHIFCDSIAKPIDMIKFNHRLQKGTAFKRAFPGATASQLNYYVQPSIKDEKPDSVIICIGTNNLTKKIQTVQETVDEIMDIVSTCRAGGVNDIYVSSLVCRPTQQTKINEINYLLQVNAKNYNYKFIDNVCIESRHLWKDRVHLNKEGTRLLANNFLWHLNNCSFSHTY